MSGLSFEAGQELAFLIAELKAENKELEADNKQYVAACRQFEETVEALENVIKFALDRCHEDNYLMVLHWDAHDLLKETLKNQQESKNG